ncbi:MAG: ATP-binding protein, partial [Chloroflexota bacterium]
LKDSVNEMIRNLRDSTQKTTEQDWLKTSLAHFSRLLQGQRDLGAVARLVLSELAPLVDVQRGAFYVADDSDGRPALRLVASYAADPADDPSARIAFGEGLVGQAAAEGRRILVTEIPSHYVPIRSSLGKAAPTSIVVLPLRFDGETRGVVEVASFHEVRDIHLSFLDQLAETLGIVLNTISTNMRAEELVQEQAGRAEAEAGLARLRQVVDVMPEAILLADATGRVYLSNAAAAEIMGTVPTSVIPTEEEAVTVRWIDGAPCPPEEQPLARAVFDNEVVRGERLIVTNAETGREVPILVNSAPLSDALGVRAGGVAVFQDITPLRELDRQKDEFLAAISHDLKTPATIIKGRANLLQRAIQSNSSNMADLAEGLEAIDDTTAQLVRIVDELLDQTRVRMGKPFELDRGPSDLLKIARRLANEYQNISPRHDIRVDSELHGLLGDWDEARMERVVANLIANGVKYSPQGGEVIVRVEREEHEGELFASLTVADQGMGIPPDEVDRVFEPYFRASNVARTVSGTGVGLTGTRQIVEQHGGTISIASIVGKSTVVTVCLPVIREPAEPLEV